MATESRLARDTRQLIEENGLPDVIAAIATWSHETGRLVAFRRLNKLYEYLITRVPNADLVIKKAKKK